MQIHHIGYLVGNMEEACMEFARLGYKRSKPPCYDADRRIQICFMQNGAIIVELIAPEKDCDLLRGLSKKIGNAPYHICYVSEDLDADIEKLQRMEYFLTQPPAKASAIDGRRVAFLMNDNIGLIELLER